MDHKALIAPFDPYFIQWKAQATSKDNTRALAVAYIDARAVMDRLDEVIGPGDWQDEYIETALGVVCTLRVRNDNGEWVGKTDIGQTGGSGRTDPGKTGYSDAFKRAAVKWGIGRYLYRLPAKWVGYDSRRKQLTETPELPPWAMPRSDEQPDTGYVGEPEDQIEDVPLKPRPPVEQKQQVGKSVDELVAQGKTKMEGNGEVQADLDYVPDWLDTNTPRQWGRLTFEARQHLGYEADKHAEAVLKNVLGDDYQEQPYAAGWSVLVDHQRAKVEAE